MHNLDITNYSTLVSIERTVFAHDFFGVSTSMLYPLGKCQVRDSMFSCPNEPELMLKALYRDLSPRRDNKIDRK